MRQLRGSRCESGRNCGMGQTQKHMARGHKSGENAEFSRNSAGYGIARSLGSMPGRPLTLAELGLHVFEHTKNRDDTMGPISLAFSLKQSVHGAAGKQQE